MFKKSSITYKYLKASIFIVIIPIIVANIVLNKLYLDTLLGSYSDRILQNTEKLYLEISSEFKTDTALASAIANDKEIIELVNNCKSDEDGSLKALISKRIEDKLGYLADLDTAVFFIKGKGMYFCKNKPSINEKEIRGVIKNSGVDNKGEVKVLDSFKGITEASSGKYICSIVASSNVGGENMEAVYFSFYMHVLNNISSYKVFGNSGKTFILDSEGKILVSGDKNITDKTFEKVNSLIKSYNNNHSFTSVIDGKKTLITSYTMLENGLKIICMVDYKDLTVDIDKIKDFAFVFTGMIIILFLVFSLLFFRDILIPVDNLTKKMKIVEKGYLDATIEIRGNDEMNNLGKSFNNMVSEIRKLINERDIKEKEKEKAEIEALQSQINPHFISNTLNSIRLMAMIAKAESIKNMTEAFMKLLTSTFNRRGIFNTVETEIDILKSYIYIMNVRFGDKFEVTFDVDVAIKQFYILKLVLQPILENAILHGISDMEDKGLIIIKGYRINDDLLVEIKDNGKGMTKEELNDLMSEGYRNTKGFNGMGLMNVDKRIKLNHGERYGLKIESSFGEFTSVKILLPIILFEQGGNLNV